MSDAVEIDPPKKASADAIGQAPKPGAWGRAIGWGFETFGPLIAFVLFEHTLGLVAAIISGIVTGAVLVTLQIVREKKFSPFTAFIAASVVVFGALDLHYRTGFFVKIEPALGNAVTAIFFLGTVAIGKPLLIELAEKRAGKSIPARAHGFLRAWTVLFALYFFLRCAAYVWMAYHLTIDQAMAARSVIGPISFGVVFAIVFLSRRIVFGKGKLAPDAQ